MIFKSGWNLQVDLTFLWHALLSTLRANVALVGTVAVVALIHREIRATLAAVNAAVVRVEKGGRTIAFSSVSQTAAARLLRDAKLQLVDGEDEELRVARAPISAFSWGSLSEAAGTPRALSHVQAALCSLGVRFGPGGYALLDMHTRQSIYALRVENTLFAGGADALIVPHGIAPLSAPSEARVVVELKNLRKPLGDSALGQSLTELLASNGTSSHPCLVLLTDGTACDVLRLTAGTVTRWAGRTLAEALTYVADYLLHDCTPARRFVPEEVPCFSTELGSTRALLAELAMAAAPGGLSAMVEQLDSLLSAEQADWRGSDAQRARAEEIAAELVAQWRPVLEPAELPQHVMHMFA
jgi:hypothetical protein